MHISPDFSDFTAKFEAGENQVLWATLPADMDTPVSLMLKLAQARRDSFMLESVTGGDTRGRYSFIGLKPDVIWRCRGNIAEINRSARFDETAYIREELDPLTSLRALLEESQIDLPRELPPGVSGLFGYLGYDMVRHVEKLPNINKDVLGLPDGIMMRPTVLAVVDSVKDEVTLVAPVWADDLDNARAAYAQAAERLMDAALDMERAVPQDAIMQDAEVGEPVSNTTKERYFEMVEQAKEYIKAGDIFQVVPSQRWSIDFPLPPFALYRSLRRTNPSPYMFYFNFGGFQIVGASPEILVRVRDGKVTIRPIAGTRPRGATPEEDDALEADLLADKKELSEHLMLLDLGRNDVGRVAKVGTVDPNQQFSVERYSHVMHIVSNVEGELRDDIDALGALLAGMPAGTVSGAPKVRAMEIIDELESEKRGIYAGGVGYISSADEMDMCIALRTSVVKDGKVYVQAGGGVVYDSDPEAEYQETVNKSKALMRAAQEAAKFTGRRNW